MTSKHEKRVLIDAWFLIMQSTCQYYFAYDFPTKERNQIP